MSGTSELIHGRERAGAMSNGKMRHLADFVLLFILRSIVLQRFSGNRGGVIFYLRDCAAAKS